MQNIHLKIFRAHTQTLKSNNFEDLLLSRLAVDSVPQLYQRNQTKHSRPEEHVLVKLRKELVSKFRLVQSFHQVGHWGDMADDLAEILFQSFLREAHCEQFWHGTV